MHLWIRKTLNKDTIFLSFNRKGFILLFFALTLNDNSKKSVAHLQHHRHPLGRRGALPSLGYLPQPRILGAGNGWKQRFSGQQLAAADH